jgi:hypothetical protein
MNTKLIGEEISDTTRLVSFDYLSYHSDLLWAELGGVYSALGSRVHHIVFRGAKECVPDTTGVVTLVEYLESFWHWAVGKLPCKYVGKYHSSWSAKTETAIPMIVNLCSPDPAWSKIRSHYRPILINFGPKTLFYVRLIWRHCDPFNRSAGVGRVGALPAHSSSVAQLFLPIIQGRPRVRSNER